jgi:hypothetical protein
LRIVIKLFGLHFYSSRPKEPRPLRARNLQFVTR